MYRQVRMRCRTGKMPILRIATYCYGSGNWSIAPVLLEFFDLADLHQRQSDMVESLKETLATKIVDFKTSGEPIRPGNR